MHGPCANITEALSQQKFSNPVGPPSNIRSVVDGNLGTWRVTAPVLLLSALCLEGYLPAFFFPWLPAQAAPPTPLRDSFARGLHCSREHNPQEPVLMEQETDTL